MIQPKENPVQSFAICGTAVVSLNGVVASLGVMERMVWVTGFRDPRPLHEYRGGAGVAFANADPPTTAATTAGFGGRDCLPARDLSLLGRLRVELV